jgi:hypothetical protein
VRRILVGSLLGSSLRVSQSGTPYDKGTFVSRLLKFRQRLRCRHGFWVFARWALQVVDIVIPKNYPFEPPKMRFDTKVWHPNVSRCRPSRLHRLRF